MIEPDCGELIGAAAAAEPGDGDGAAGAALVADGLATVPILPDLL